MINIIITIIIITTNDTGVTIRKATGDSTGDTGYTTGDSRLLASPLVILLAADTRYHRKRCLLMKNHMGKTSYS